MRLTLVLALLLALAAAAPAKKSKFNTDVTCSVCATIVDIIQQGVDETEDSSQLQVRFRVDEKKTIPYSRSETRLLELVEPVCYKTLKDYAFGDHYGPPPGKTRRLRKTDEIKNADHNADIRKICDFVMDDNQEALIKDFMESKTATEVKEKFCVKRTSLCQTEVLEALLAPPPAPAVEEKKSGDDDDDVPAAKKADPRPDEL